MSPWCTIATNAAGLDFVLRACQHLATPLKDAVEGDEGGLGGVITPWVILGGVIIPWVNLSVTGNGDLPLATQRRVESIASDRSPSHIA